MQSEEDNQTAVEIIYLNFYIFYPLNIYGPKGS